MRPKTTLAASPSRVSRPYAIATGRAWAWLNSVRGALIRQEKAVAGNQRHEPNHERANTRLGCHRCKGNGDKRCGGLPAKH